MANRQYPVPFASSASGSAFVTQLPGDSSTSAATTAFVNAQAPAAPTGSYFWGYTYDPNTFQSTSVQDPAIRGANVVKVIMMHVKEYRVINKVYFRIDTPGTLNMIFGFYNLSGNLVADTGLLAGNTNNNSLNLSPSITLPAGWYYFAWACDTAGSGAQMPSLAHQPLDNNDAAINIDMTRWGFMDNSHLVSGGHMPPTMGPLTNTKTPTANCMFIT